jgi:hypothetical protein
MAQTKEPTRDELADLVFPPEDPTLEEMKQRFFALRLRRRHKRLEGMALVAAMFEQAPAWLDLEPAEKRRAQRLLERIADEYPATSMWELVWCLAIDAVRPGASGRKPKWLGIDGIVFVGKVEAALRACGAKSSDAKALLQVIAVIRDRSPEDYADYSDERLRKAYYEALPRFRALHEI